MTDETKTCTKCGRELPLDQFYLFKDHRYKAGYQRKRQCKDCGRAYKRQHDVDMKAAGMGRINLPVDRRVWAAFRRHAEARGMRLAEALELLIRRELIRERERQVALEIARGPKART